MNVRDVISEISNIIMEKNNNKMNSSEDRQLYDALYRYYSDFKEIGTHKELMDFKGKLVSEYMIIQSNYDDTYALYSKMVSEKAPVEETNKYASLLNTLVYRARAIKMYLNVLNKYLMNNKFISMKEEKTVTQTTQTKTQPVQGQTQRTSTQTQQQTTQVQQTATQTQQTTNRPTKQAAVGFKPEFIANKDTLEYLRYCRKVKKDMVALSKLQSGSKEYNEMQKQLYADITERNNYVKGFFADSPEKLKEAYSYLFPLISKERLLYMEPQTETIPEEDINATECMSRINDYVTEINELKFADKTDTRRIHNVTYKFENLIEILSKTLHSRKVEELGRDLLNLALTFNMDGNYGKFKKYYKDEKIGTQETSREMYKKSVKSIETKKQELFDILNRVLGENKVHIVSQEKTFVEKESEIYESHYKICDSILELTKHIQR